MNASSLPAASRWLTRSAQFWFLVALVGQWLFVTYIIGFYGVTTFNGNLAGWNEVLAHGYVEGNLFNNLMVGAHMLFAAIITFCGPLQLIPWIRNHYPAFHRWNGRVYIPTVFILSLGGIYMTWFHDEVVGDFLQHITMTAGALLTMFCAVQAVRYAMQRQFTTHRRWAIRTFMLVSAVWFFRLGIMAWITVNGGPVGFDAATFTGPFISIWSVGQFVLPLGITEVYFRAEVAGHSFKWVAAALIGVLTLLMALGIATTTLFMWLPRI